MEIVDRSKNGNKKPEEEFSWLDDVENSPCRYYCFAWSMFLATLILLVVVASSGFQVINFQTTVPMYLRNHKSYVAQTALEQAAEQANAPLLDDNAVLREREEQEWSLEIIYETDGRNTMLSSEVLSAIVDFENEILNTARFDLIPDSEIDYIFFNSLHLTTIIQFSRYTDFCQLRYPTDGSNDNPT
ncbi:MAG: hypothetical protein AAGM67_21200, partial [Bacteroidota bacterium]